MRDASFDSNNEKLDIFGSQDRSRSQSPSNLFMNKKPSPPKESHFKYIENPQELNLIIEKDKEMDGEVSESHNETDSDNEIITFDEKIRHSVFDKICFLPNQIHCKQKILQNVEKIKESEFENYEEYYENIIDAGINLIKLAFTIYDEKTFERLKHSVHRLKEIMKSKHVKIPVMVSMEYKIMRFDSNSTVNFKRAEKTNFCFYSIHFQKEKNFDNLPQEIRNNLHMISNSDYMMMNKVTPGDKIIIDFGTAVFLVTKVFYKNGKCLQLPEKPALEKEYLDLIESEKSYKEEKENFSLDYSEVDIEESQYSIDKNLELDLKKLMEKFYQGKKFQEKKQLDPCEEIDYIEVLTLFDCKVNPHRPVQVLKKIKYDKYDYVPDLYYIYAEKLIKEIDFEYLIIDYVSPNNFNFFKEKMKKFNKNIPIITKLTDIYSLNYLDLIVKNSVSVIISFNNLIKEVPFLDIVIMTEKLIRLFKKNGLAVYCHSQTLESMKKKSKPSPSEINDILLFLQSGVDGFNLGSETFLNNSYSIFSLREILIDFMRLLPTVKKLRPIYNLTQPNEDSNSAQVNAISLYNSLRKNDSIILILVSDDEVFLSSFLSYNLYNNIVLVTNRSSIMKRFLLFSITHCILVKEISSQDEEEKERIERELVNLIKEDHVVKTLIKKKDSCMIFVKSLKGENLETFSYNNF
jgi:pyruvate kinase